jgi:hypothetical protein
MRITRNTVLDGNQRRLQISLDAGGLNSQQVFLYIEEWCLLGCYAVWLL